MTEPGEPEAPTPAAAEAVVQREAVRRLVHRHTLEEEWDDLSLMLLGLPDGDA